MEDVKTDTTVVPGGIVAAMKALREKERAAKGNNSSGKHGKSRVCNQWKAREKLCTWKARADLRV